MGYTRLLITARLTRLGTLISFCPGPTDNGHRIGPSTGTRRTAPHRCARASEMFPRRRGQPPASRDSPSSGGDTCPTARAGPACPKLPGDVAVEVGDLPLALTPVDDELDTSRCILDRDPVEHLSRYEVVDAIPPAGELVVRAAVTKARGGRQTRVRIPLGPRGCAVSSTKVRVDPHLQCPIVLFWITNDDRAKLAPIPPAQDCRIEGNGRGQPGDVITIDRTISGQLGQGQVMRVEREKPQASEPSGEELDQTLLVRLGQARDAHVLKMNAMFLGEGRIGARSVLQGRRRVVRNHLDVVEVIGWTRQIVVEGGDESTKAADLDGLRQLAVNIAEESAPRIWGLRRRNGGHRRSSPSAGSSAWRLRGAAR